MLKLNLKAEEKVTMSTIYFDGYKVTLPESEAQKLLETLAENYKVSAYDINSIIDTVQSLPERLQEARQEAKRYRITFTATERAGHTVYKVSKDVRNRIPKDVFDIVKKTLADRYGIIYNSGEPFYGAFMDKDGMDDKLKWLEKVQYCDDITEFNLQR